MVDVIDEIKAIKARLDALEEALSPKRLEEAMEALSRELDAVLPKADS